MGFWGDGVFQSDRDIDFLCAFEAHPQANLYVPDQKEWRDNGDPVQTRENSRRKLNANRALHNKFKQLRDDEKAGKSAGPDFDLPIGGGFHVAIVILGAAAMGVGANIRNDDREYMKEVLKTRCFGMYDKEKKDLLKALDEYENGKPLKVMAPGLFETMNSGIRSPLCIPGMMNVPDPGMFSGHETVPLALRQPHPQNEGLWSPQDIDRNELLADDGDGSG
ncbi:hypothetical protein HDK77DRAFT_487548 [Phyllosticta capitalensis]